MLLGFFYLYSNLFLMKTQNLLLMLTLAIVSSCATKAPAVPGSTAKSSETAASGQVAKTTSPKELVMTKELIEGKELFESNCAKCHALPNATEYSKERWSPILVNMQKKAHLDDLQMSSISNYIYAQL